MTMIYDFSDSATHNVTSERRTLKEPSATATHSRERRFVSTPARGDGWLADAMATLERFRSLADGWNGYKGKRPQALALRVAHDVLEAAWVAGLKPTRLAPSVVGGVGFTFASDDREVYIEVYNRDGKIYAVYQDRSAAGEADIKPVQFSPSELVVELRRASRYLRGD